MSWKTILQWTLSFVLSILLLALLFWLADISPQALAQSVEKAGLLSVALVVAIMTFQLIAQAISWKLLLQSSGHQVSFSSAFSAILTGWAGNAITPSMYLGGEPLRAFVLSRRGEISFSQSLSSVMVHKFLELCSFLFFMLLSAGLVFWYYSSVLSLPVQITIVFCLAVLVAAFALILLTFLRKKPFLSTLGQWCQKKSIFPQFFEKNLPRLVEMEEAVFQSFHQDRYHSLISLGVLLFFHLSIVLRPLLFFPFVQAPLYLAELALIFLLVQLIQAIQLTPGGLGIVEGGIVGILALLEIAPAHALGYASFCRVGDLLLVGWGIFLLFHFGLSGKLSLSTEEFSQEASEDKVG